MGISDFHGGEVFSRIGDATEGRVAGNIAGTYLHGFFEEDELRHAVVNALCEKKNVVPAAGWSFREEQDRQYDLVADALRDHLDMGAIRRIIGLE